MKMPCQIPTTSLSMPKVKGKADGKLVNTMALATLDEWPNVSLKQIDQFISWYFITTQQLNLSEPDLQLLLEV